MDTYDFHEFTSHTCMIWVGFQKKDPLFEWRMPIRSTDAGAGGPSLQLEIWDKIFPQWFHTIPEQKQPRYEAKVPIVFQKSYCKDCQEVDRIKTEESQSPWASTNICWWRLLMLFYGLAFVGQSCHPRTLPKLGTSCQTHSYKNPTYP